jgi:zinc transport system ATP-binding protein
MPLQINKEKHSPVIVVDQVSFSYHRTDVLKNISFQVKKGEFIGIIGPNGGGKTTLLKLLMGFLKPTSGSISLFDKKLQSVANGSFHVSYVPQAVRFDRDFPISVEEVVLSGLLSLLPWYGRFRKKEREAAQEALYHVGLDHLARASFGTLSGGQAQRVLIARALVSQPQLLLLDEPTASVDSQAEAEIYAILKRLKGNMTILMVTHDLQAMIDHVERVLCVRGQVFSMQPEEMCEHFSLGLYHVPLQTTPSN